MLWLSGFSQEPCGSAASAPHSSLYNGMKSLSVMHRSAHCLKPGKPIGAFSAAHRFAHRVLWLAGFSQEPCGSLALAHAWRLSNATIKPFCDSVAKHWYQSRFEEYQMLSAYAVYSEAG